MAEQKRVFILVLDSFGIGATADAVKYGDQDADTFGHIAQACAHGLADIPGVREGKLNIPNMMSMGLGQAWKISTGKNTEAPQSALQSAQAIHNHDSGHDSQDSNSVTISNSHATSKVKSLNTTTNPNQFTGAYGCAAEMSLGKDTPSGHWEMMSVPVMFEWGYFPPDYPSFPEELLNKLQAECNLPGFLGNSHASGTEIIERYGKEHCESGKPIVYTSADSVFQIAAHEEHFGLDKLYEVCDVTRKLVDEYNIGRVIARPFVGEPGNYERTGNRKDIATPPPSDTVLDKLAKDGGQVISVGKIADIFAHRGITDKIKAHGNMNLFDAMLDAQKIAGDRSIVFTNFVDFDSVYGHRRNTAGYANALEELDARLPDLQKIMRPSDIAIITADHGCDPTAPGSDHTREHIPVVVFGPKVKPAPLGKRKSFADIGQTIADYLDIDAMDAGESFLDKII